MKKASEIEAFFYFFFGFRIMRLHVGWQFYSDDSAWEESG
jgi:hypothetical protein